MASKDGDAIKVIEVTQVQKLDKGKPGNGENKQLRNSPFLHNFFPDFLHDFPPEDPPLSGSLQSTDWSMMRPGGGR